VHSMMKQKSFQGRHRQRVCNEFLRDLWIRRRWKCVSRSIWQRFALPACGRSSVRLASSASPFLWNQFQANSVILHSDFECCDLFPRTRDARKTRKHLNRLIDPLRTKG
jgi:hypothetical protein